MFITYTLYVNYKHIYLKTIPHLTENKTSSLTHMNLIILFIFLLIAIGTFFPSLYTILFKKQLFLDSAFYIKSILPLIFLLTLIMSLTNLYNLKDNIITQKLIYFILGFTIISNISLYYLNITLITKLSIYFSLLLILTISYNNYLTDYKLNKKMIKSHIAFGLLLLTIALNKEYEIDIIENLRIGETIKLKEYELTLLDINELKGKNYNNNYSKLSITLNSKLLGIISPDIHYYTNLGILTNKTEIISNGIKDIQVTLNNIQSTENITLRIKEEPYQGLIWISIIILLI